MSRGLRRVERGRRFEGQRERYGTPAGRLLQWILLTQVGHLYDGSFRQTTAICPF